MDQLWPDDLTEWALAPGEVEPVPVFDTADAVMAFLFRLGGYHGT